MTRKRRPKKAKQIYDMDADEAKALAEILGLPPSTVVPPAKIELKLKPRPVPQPLWGKCLRNAIGSRWINVSRDIRNAAGNRCEICGSVSYFSLAKKRSPSSWTHCCDEVWAYEDENRTCYLADLQCICWWCNAMIHAGHTHANTPECWEDVFKHACLVNDCHQTIMIAAIELEQVVWNDRSRHSDWSIDWDDWETVFSEKLDRLLTESAKPKGKP